MSNVKNIVSSWPEKIQNHLTQNGTEKARRAIEELKKTCAEQGKNIDLIFASDLDRTKETAEIASALLGVKPEYDKRLREIGFGVFNSGPAEKFENYFKNQTDRINQGAPEGENYTDVLKRVSEFLEEINNKYKDLPAQAGKNILIISHQAPLFLLEGYMRGFSIAETLKNFPDEKMLNKAELREIN